MSTTEREIDWKAVERGEQKVRHGSTDRVVKDVRVFDDGAVAVRFVDGDQFIYPTYSLHIFELLPPEPKRLTVWLNLYADEACGPYYTRQAADNMATGKRLDCRDITWTVPQ